MNVPLICLSLRYSINKVRSSKLKIFYENISKVSKWFYHELVRCNYNDNKLVKALDKKDYKIIKSIITFVQDKGILDKYLPIYYDNLDILKLLIDNGVNIHQDYDQVLTYVSYYYYYVDGIKLLIDGAIY